MATAATALTGRMALSLSGSGHLLVYQLGSCQVLQESKIAVPSYVVGSSGGSIAATILALMPSQLEEYAHRFIEARGRGLSLLDEMLDERDATAPLDHPTLGICVTVCKTGAAQVFDFPPHLQIDNKHLKEVIRASCHIPISFHPADMISSSPKKFSPEEGVSINGEYYVDGGIAAPVPPTPNAHQRVICSPISGPTNDILSIRPLDTSMRLFPIRLPFGFRVYSSIQNLKALGTSAGFTNSPELQVWYERGREDGLRFLERMSVKSTS